MCLFAAKGVDSMDAGVLIGRMLGSCQLQQVIGSGTMGVVYRAAQARSGRPLAVKAMVRATSLDSAFQQEFLESFRRSAALAAALNHAHIVHIVEYGDHDGIAYATMPYIQGETLEQRLVREGALPLSLALHYLEQIATALDYAHARGIPHGDLKPANIFVTRGEHLLVADFQLTQALKENTTARMRLSTHNMLDYMAPELVTGKPLDGRADLYSLGAILFRVVTGISPFQAPTLMKVATKHVKTPPPSPRALRSDLPLAAEQAILKALAKQPEERYTCAQDFALLFGQAVRQSRQETFTASNQQSIWPIMPVIPVTASVSPPSPDPSTEQTGRSVGMIQPGTAAQRTLSRSRWRAAVLSAITDEAEGEDTSSTDALPFGKGFAVKQSQPFPSLATDPRITFDGRDEAVASAGTEVDTEQPVRDGRNQPVTPPIPMPHPSSPPISHSGPITLLVPSPANEPAPQPPARLMQQAPYGATGTLNSLKLTGPAKILSIPVAGQPGQYITGILPTQPLTNPASAGPKSQSDARFRQAQPKMLGVLALVLVLVLGSVSYWLVRTATYHPAGLSTGAQTASSGAPNLGAMATARAEATQDANIILIDPLTQNIHDWPATTKGTILYQFQDNAYLITNNDPDNIAPAILQNINLDKPFAYSLTMEEIHGDDSSINNEFGMILRFSTQLKNGKQLTSFYSFEVLNNQHGEYQFWKFDNSAPGNPWKELGHHPFNGEFKQGHGQSSINTFKILANGKNFTLIVNDKQVWSVSDGSLTTGSVGMLVNLKGTEVAFSDLRLTNH